MARDIFERALSALREAEAHAKGDDPAGLVVHVPETVDVAGIRKRTGKAQPAFAASIGVPVATLRQWEHRRRQPQGPARVLLALLDRNPHLVEETLGEPS
ncbi:helix-turn-helix domain-containing protein [Methylobacterium soli]|jgi:putative transcriptional regulator|uniref:Transcriptional regulator n=1 Tax=Methylobacterium soli TaxID=553447 RepID=A0A6L3SXA0_9HYPH|nr:transcriptional regulator [Methylobacterium soli]KAB1076811.1 transcriptional regulator [Methylobacterium soli]GJE46154.1 Antitoxin HigA-2 [Methylobacterium soli]